MTIPCEPVSYHDRVRQESSPGIQDDITAIRVAVEGLTRGFQAVEGRLDSIEARMLRLEDRQFQTILAVLGTFVAAFGANLAALLG